MQSRVEERFPVGGPEAGIAEYLTSQGFKPERIIMGEEANYVFGRAVLLEGMGICDTGAQVTWRANSKGVLTELLVLYGDTGCF